MLGSSGVMCSEGWAANESSKEKELDKAEALDKFLASVERRAFQVAVLATRDKDESLDIVQDAMLSLVQRYAAKKTEEWTPLFYRILHSRINDWHRKNAVRKRWRIWLKAGGDEEGAADPLENLADFRQPDIEQQLTVEHDYQVVQQALILRSWEGLSVSETAFVMRCSEGSVKTHCSRAIKSLRNKLEKSQ